MKVVVDVEDHKRMCFCGSQPKFDGVWATATREIEVLNACVMPVYGMGDHRCNRCFIVDFSLSSLVLVGRSLVRMKNLEARTE